MVKTRRSSSANNLVSLESEFARLGHSYGRNRRYNSSRPASPLKKKAKIEERRVSQFVEPKSPRKSFGPTSPKAGPSSSRFQKGDAPRQKSKASKFFKIPKGRRTTSK